jgi:tripartite ATP-independent transporter DctM subunit
MSILLIVTLGVLIALVAGLPVAVTLGAVGLAWIAAANPVMLTGAAHAVWNTASNDVLTAVPLFILMGEIIQRSEIAPRFYDAVSIWVRWLPGGMVHANIAACGIFSAVSGSSVATAATIGTAAMPNLMRLGYDHRLIYGSLAAGGTLGILIPPSLALIFYSAMTEVSLGRLFVAAMLPGLMMMGLFHAYILARAVVSLRQAVGRDIELAPVGWAERLRSLAAMAPVILNVIVILHGMYWGWATPTEIAGVAAAMALIVAVAFGTFSLTRFWDALVRSARLTAMLMFIVIGAQIFAFAVFSSGLNFEIADWIAALPYGPYEIFFFVVVMYVVLGMFIDALSMMVLTLSLVFPVILEIGFDPIWFGIVLVLLLELGLITPPVGMNLYTIRAIAPVEASLRDVTMGALPFAFMLALGVVILTAFPDIVLWLPAQMFR